MIHTINESAIFMKESPFTSIDIQKYNSFSWYNVDINKEFNSSISQVESKVNDKFPGEKPESVKVALYYYRKATYEYYLENTRAKHVNPGAWFVGPSNYKGNPDKARRIEQKASEKLDTAREYLRKAVKRELNNIDKKSTELENNIQVGDKIKVWWTNCNRQYSASATIKKINVKTMVVTLNESTSSDYGEYPENWDITIPLVCTKGNKWESLNSTQKTTTELNNETYEELKGKFSVGETVYNTFYRFTGTIIKINKKTMVIKGNPEYARDDGLRKVSIDEIHNKRVEAI